MTSIVPAFSPSDRGRTAARQAGRALRLLPGVTLCVGVTAGAAVLEAVERGVFGRAWLETLVLAILLGAAMRTVWTPGERWRAGIEFSGRVLLQLAVVLLGASLSPVALIAAGPALLAGVAAVVVVVLAIGYGVGRAVGLPRRLAALVACGNVICGNSAIAAVAPVIGADGEDVAASIAFTAVLGVGVVLALPLVGAGLHMRALPYGALAGLTVYAVPQVLAAAAPGGATAVQFGTVVKLARVLMLGPVCVGLSLATRRSSTEPGQPNGRPSLRQLLPWFIVGFAALAAARGVGAIPASVASGASRVASPLTAVSMAALGLSTDLRTVMRAGARTAVAATGALAILGVASLALIAALGLS